MPAKKSARRKFIKYHNDGTIWATGYMAGTKPDGYFEWFRKDGTRMRSGYFSKGKQVGTWTTYDKKGGIVRTTTIK